MSQKKKTVGQLFASFNERYKIDDVSKSVGLQTLYGYLANQTKHNNGDYIHEPSDYIQVLLKSHLDYELPKGVQFKAGKAMNGDTWKDRCRSCFYLETCQYLEYDIREQVMNCKSYKLIQ